MLNTCLYVFHCSAPEKYTVNQSWVHKTQRTPPLVAKEGIFHFERVFWLFWMNLELFIYSGLYPLMLWLYTILSIANAN